MAYSFVLHGNLQYAEIPKQEIPTVIEKAYTPTITSLLEDDIPFGLNLTGYSLQYLPDELIQKIKQGIAQDLIELTGTAYTHAILPLLPLDRVQAQIQKDKEVKEETFGVTPTSFWLPELAYDPILPGILKENGYENVFIDGEALLFSQHLNSAIESIDPLYPHLIKAQQGDGIVFLNYLLGLWELKKTVEKAFGGKITVNGVKNITGIPVWVGVNTLVMFGIGGFPLIGVNKVANQLKNLNEAIIYGWDIEFFGYRPIHGRMLQISKLKAVIEKLGNTICLPSALKKRDTEMYLRTSSWAPDKSLKLWSEDAGNRRLNYLASRNKSFIAENSDARGWEPLPERRLDAFRGIYNTWREKNHEPQKNTKK